MSDTNPIRGSARGKDCLVRIPHVCNWDPDTTIAAHIRLAGVAGTGIKPSDILTVRACSACHDVMDGRGSPPVPMSTKEIQLYVHHAHCRTLLAYIREGLIHVEGQ